MNKLDLLNGFWEAMAAFMVWGNVRELLRAKAVVGVRLSVTGYYLAWGMSSMVYYWNLGHMWSLAGNVAIVAANGTWLGLALYYRHRPKT